MLSGITTAQQLAIQRLEFQTGKSKKPKVLGANGFSQPVFGNINANRYANGGTNPVFGQNPEDLYPDLYGNNGMPLDGENGVPPEGDVVPTPSEPPKTEPTRGTNPDNKPDEEPDPDKLKSEGASSVSSARAQGTNVENQTVVTTNDASTSTSHKQASIDNKRKVEEDVIKLEKERKKYEKDLVSTQKKVELEQKKMDENATRMEELQTRAESLQGTEGEEGAESRQGQIANIAQEMATITADTKTRTTGLDKTISNQKTQQKKATDNSKKFERAFGNMTSIGVDYAGTNDTVQKTAETVKEVSDVVSSVGEVTRDVGGTIEKTGIGLIASGTAMSATGFGAAAGAALIATGTELQSTGRTVETVGDVVHYVGEAGSVAAKTTTGIAQDARTSIDLFTETSEMAEVFGAGVTKDIKGSNKDIDKFKKDNQALKKQVTQFQTMTQQVASMGGGGLARAMGGQSGEGTVGPTNPYADMMSGNNNMFASSGDEQNYDNIFDVDNRRKNIFA